MWRFSLSSPFSSHPSNLPRYDGHVAPWRDVRSAGGVEVRGPLPPIWSQARHGQLGTDHEARQARGRSREEGYMPGKGLGGPAYAHFARKLGTSARSVHSRVQKISKKRQANHHHKIVHSMCDKDCYGRLLWSDSLLELRILS